MKFLSAVIGLGLIFGSLAATVVMRGSPEFGPVQTTMLAMGVFFAAVSASIKGPFLPTGVAAHRLRYGFAAVGALIVAASVGIELLPDSYPGFGTTQTMMLALGAFLVVLGALYRGPILQRILSGLKNAVVVLILLVVATDVAARLFTVYDRRATDSFYRSYFFRSIFYQTAAVPDRLQTINPFLIIPPVTHAPFNAEGFRSAHSVRDPVLANEARIFALGGSTTENLSSNASYPEVWERLYDDSPGPGRPQATVFNAGRSAYSTNQMLVRFATDVIHFNPDIVTAMEAANDIHELFFLREGQALRPRDAKYLSPTYFAPNRIGPPPDMPGGALIYSPLLNRHRLLNIVFDKLGSAYGPEADKKEVVFSEELIEKGLAEYRANLVALCRLAHGIGIRVVLMSQPMNFDAVGSAVFERATFSSHYPSKKQYIDIHDRYTRTMRQVAEQEGAVYVPMKEMFAEQPDPARLFVDSMHYSNAGAALFAQLSMPYIRGIVDALPPRSPEPADFARRLH